MDFNSKSKPTHNIESTVLDIGCGPSKVENAWGIDIFQYPEVNQILDLNETPWDLPSNHFKTIYAHHVIEHVSSIPDFMNEVHRISKHGATLHVITPHFSSVDSYSDPTHKWHLSSAWHIIMTDSYLQAQVPKFSHVQTKISFGKSVFALFTQIIIKLKGVGWWEKKLAFVLRARNIETEIKVEKQE